MRRAHWAPIGIAGPKAREEPRNDATIIEYVKIQACMQI